MDADKLGWLQAPRGILQLRRGVMTSGRSWSEISLYSWLGERGGDSLRQCCYED